MTVPVFVLAALFIGLYLRLGSRNTQRSSLVWGSTPLLNNRHWSHAMRAAGYRSETFTTMYYGTINKRSDWDRILDEEWTGCPATLKPLLAFLDSLLRYDVFFISADGYFIGHTIGLWRLQAPLLRFCGKKTVFIPYGSDTYVYRRVRSTALLHGLLASYPEAAKRQAQVAARLDYWCRHADACVPAVMGIDGFGRWDVLTTSPLCLDLNEWPASSRRSPADGSTAPVVICHAPNHRGFKGTEFVIDAVNQLKQEGLKVELVLLEKIQNDKVRQILQNDADILIEQLIFTGHGLNGLEGMASGIPVISNLEDEAYITPIRRWSFFSECPLVSASPETLVDVLRKLITRPQLRHDIGRSSRAYVEKYHDLDSAAYLFEAVVDYVHKRRESLINLYHPILGEYPNRSAKIVSPLLNNKIVD